MRWTSLCYALVVVSVVAAAQAADSAYPRAELLLEPTVLKESLRSGKYLVIDAREKAAYEKGHIPGAAWIDPAEWAKAFGDGKDAKGWSQRIGKLGIAAASKVVVYDDSYSKDAARIWWILSYWGVKDVQLLNGGWSGWTAAKGAVQTETPDAFPDTEFAARPRAEKLATKEELLAAIVGKKTQIVDARSKNEHCGIDALKNKRAGAMPGASNLEWIDLLDKETHRFKQPEELTKLFRGANIDVKGDLACHCQGGGRSSVMAFALELMGAENVSNYYAGWGEWGNSDDTPIVKPEKP